MRTVKRKYHYFYKITNNLNGHYYYGIHSTDDLDDGYMGSGTRLKYAYEKYGIENFTKDILEFFETREDAAKHEAEVVNEMLIKDENCYNISLGGDGWKMVGTTTMQDLSGKYYRVSVDDPRVLAGYLVGPNKGKANYKDSNGNLLRLSVDDPRVLSGEVESYVKGIGTYKDSNGNLLRLSVDDPRVLSGEVVSMNKGKTLVKDANGKFYNVSINDPRYISGELKPAWCGRKHTLETKEKQKQTFKYNNHQKGEKNSQYGTCWITKNGENKKIKKEELEIYVQQGWIKGRVIKK